MATNQAQIELGVAGSNIAGNIDAILPQLADRGAECAIAGNQIHDAVKKLRAISVDFQNQDSNNLSIVNFDGAAHDIAAILPQLDGKGPQVDAIAGAIKGFLNQLVQVHAQHLHLIPGTDAEIVAVPHVNNGLGSAPFQTGTAINPTAADTSKIDPIPKPAGSEDVAFNPEPAKFI